MTANSLSFIAATAAGLMIAGGALAQDVGGFRSARVAYADLNLGNDAGVAHLYARLRAAASQVCEGTSIRALAADDCTAKALNAAVGEVHNDKLTKLHQGGAGARVVAS